MNKVTLSYLGAALTFMLVACLASCSADPNNNRIADFSPSPTSRSAAKPSPATKTTFELEEEKREKEREKQQQRLFSARLQLAHQKARLMALQLGLARPPFTPELSDLYLEGVRDPVLYEVLLEDDELDPQKLRAAEYKVQRERAGKNSASPQP